MASSGQTAAPGGFIIARPERKELLLGLVRMLYARICVCGMCVARRRLWLTYKLFQLALKDEQILVEKLLVLQRVLLSFSLRHDLRRRPWTVCRSSAKLGSACRVELSLCTSSYILYEYIRTPCVRTELYAVQQTTAVYTVCSTRTYSYTLVPQIKHKHCQHCCNIVPIMLGLQYIYVYVQGIVVVGTSD